jgi:hypothetical protein
VKLGNDKRARLVDETSRLGSGKTPEERIPDVAVG